MLGQKRILHTDMQPACDEMKKNPALQDSPPMADRCSDIFPSAAVRS